MQDVANTVSQLRQVTCKMFLIRSKIFVTSLARRSWYVVTSSSSNLEDLPDMLEQRLQAVRRSNRSTFRRSKRTPDPRIAHSLQPSHLRNRQVQETDLDKQRPTCTNCQISEQCIEFASNSTPCGRGQVPLEFPSFDYK